MELNNKNIGAAVEDIRAFFFENLNSQIKCNSLQQVEITGRNINLYKWRNFFERKVQQIFLAALTPR